MNYSHKNTFQNKINEAMDEAFNEYKERISIEIVDYTLLCLEGGLMDTLQDDDILGPLKPEQYDAVWEKIEPVLERAGKTAKLIIRDKF